VLAPHRILPGISASKITGAVQFVSQHKIHYFVTNGSGGGLGGNSGDSAQITSWVEAHFTAKTRGRDDRLRPHRTKSALVTTTAAALPG
jgi:hypothetical protein